MGSPNPWDPALDVPVPIEAITDAPAQPTAPTTQAVPIPDVNIIIQQTVELIALHAYPTQLEAGAGKAPQHNMATPPPVLPVLFADHSVINRARAVVILANNSDRKPVFPDIVPGFEASSLDICKCHIFHFAFLFHTLSIWVFIPHI